MAWEIWYPKEHPPYIGKVYWNLSCSDILVLYWTSPSRRARVVGSICTAVKDEDPRAETFSFKTKVSTFFFLSKVNIFHVLSVGSFWKFQVYQLWFSPCSSEVKHGPRICWMSSCSQWLPTIFQLVQVGPRICWMSTCYCRQLSFRFVNCVLFPRDSRKRNYFLYIQYFHLNGTPIIHVIN